MVTDDVTCTRPLPQTPQGGAPPPPHYSHVCDTTRSEVIPGVTTGYAHIIGSINCGGGPCRGGATQTVLF